jgi:nitric oxide reductase subunit B
MSYRAHWIALLGVIVGSFAILGGFAPSIYSAAPPLPSRVVGPGGAVVVEGASILRGQNVWQALGGQEVGSVWGHGAYVAPDWTADWLHREATFMLDRWAREAGGENYDAVAPETQEALRERLSRMLHENTYDAETGTIRVGAERAAAFDANAAHYADVFASGRDAYAIPAGALDDAARARDLAAFFW